MNDKDMIQRALEERLSIRYFALEDQSEFHQRHAEAKKSGGGHYQILIVSDDFEGKSLIIRHRMVYDALKDLLENKIHALSLKVLTLKEFEENDES